MKLEETENLKLPYQNNVQATTSQINNIQNSDIERAERITQIINICEKNANFKAKLQPKNGVSFVVDMYITLLNADKNNKTV